MGWRRWLLLIGLGLLLLRLGWYGVSRWLAKGAAVQIQGENPAPRLPERAGEAQEVPEAPGHTFRVGVYNIAHGRGTARHNFAGGDRAAKARRLTEIAELIQAGELDVVVINEADFQATWSHEVNQAERIARDAGYPVWVEQRNVDVSLPLSVYRFGNAVLSRHPILSAELVDYPHYSRAERWLGGQKLGLLVTVQLGEQPVRLLAVHLEHRSPAIRVETARVILELARQPGPPLLLAGDFNSQPREFLGAELTLEGDSAISVLIDGGYLTDPMGPPDKEDLTFPSTDPAEVLDWMLVPEGWEIVDREVPRVTLSDHLPVFTTLRRLEK